jgi:peptidoglycan hydrolase FlgJ
MSGLDAQRLMTQAATAAQSLSADGRSLDSLKRDAQRDPQGAVRKAAQQFEALFMQMVLKSMRDATPKSGLFDSPANDMYTGMLDQQMAAKMSQGGTGLTDVLVQQLTRHLKPPAASLAGSAADAAAPPLKTTPKPGASVAPAASTATAVPRARAALARYDEMARNADSAAPAPGSSDAQRRFVNRHFDHALAAERATGIPARFVLSQAALESGWGKAEIRGSDGLPSHNLFGIKATGGWQGRTVDVVTTEYENGVAKKVVEKFRAYNNYSESFRDWAKLMAANPRYAGVVAGGRDANAFAHGLQRAGYATDPAYGDKLARVIASVSTALRPS